MKRFLKLAYVFLSVCILFAWMPMKVRAEEVQKPANVTYIPGKEAVRLKWNPVEGVDGYEIFSVGYSGNPISQGTTTSTQFSVYKLDAGGVEMSFLVRSFKGDTYSAYSDEDIIKVRTLKDLDLLSNVRVEEIDGNRFLKWEVEEGVIGVHITAGENAYWDKQPNETELNLQWLKEGETKLLAVDPKIVDGWGNSVYITVTRPIEYPQKPANITYIPGYEAAELQWDRMDGVDGYEVFYVSGNGELISKGTTRSNSFCIHNLDAGGSITPFLVRSYKGDRYSEYTSADIINVKTLKDLDFISNVRVEIIDGKYILKWDAEEYVQGVHITAGEDGSYWDKKPGETEQELYWLDEGETTRLSIAPQIIGGWGKPAYINVTRPIEYPQKPANITYIPGYEEVRLSWDPVEGVDGYEVFHVNSYGNLISKGTTQSIIFNLKKLDAGGVEMKFLVRSYKSDRYSEYTSEDIITVKTLKDLDVISNVRVENVNGKYILKWDAEDCVRGVHITAAEDGSYWDKKPGETEQELYWLGEGESTRLSLAPQIIDGWGNPAYINITIPIQYPGKPANVIYIPGYEAAKLQWNRVDGVDGYEVFYVSGNGSLISKGTTKSSEFYLYDLDAGGSITPFLVRSYKGSRYSEYTNADIINVKTLTDLDFISNVRVEIIDGKYILKWDAEEYVQGVHITAGEDGSYWDKKPGETEQELYWLDEGETTRLSIAPQIIGGWGKSAYINVTRPIEYPGKPANVTYIPGYEAAQLQWDRVDGVDGYEVFYVSGNGDLISKGTTKSSRFTLYGLDAGGSITPFLVRSYKGSRYSEYTNADIINVKTLTDLDFISNVRVEIIDGKYILKWDAEEYVQGVHITAGEDGSYWDKKPGETEQELYWLDEGETTRLSIAPQIIGGWGKPAYITVTKFNESADDKDNDNWEVVKKAIEDSNRRGENYTHTIDMNKATIVPADVLEAIKGRDVNIVLELNKDVKWVINGMDIEKSKDIDLGVMLNLDNIPEDVLDSLDTDAQMIPVTLVHNGEFGFNATLEIAIPDASDGKYATLFYYDEEKKTLTKMEEVVVEDGKAKFPFVHASEWLILVDEEPYNEKAEAIQKDSVIKEESVKEEEKPSEVVTTGQTVDETTDGQNNAVNPWIIVLIVLVILAIAGGVIIVCMKKKEENE